VQFEVRYCDTASTQSFCFGCSRYLCLQMNFRIHFSISLKKWHWNFDGDSIESVGSFQHTLESGAFVLHWAPDSPNLWVCFAIWKLKMISDFLCMLSWASDELSYVKFFERWSQNQRGTAPTVTQYRTLVTCCVGLFLHTPSNQFCKLSLNTSLVFCNSILFNLILSTWR
jgi:hypothetical protein